MLWRGQQQSSNVEDRRGMGGGGIIAGGGVLGVLALIVNYLLGGSDTPLPLPNGNQAQSQEERQASSNSSWESVWISSRCLEARASAGTA